MKLSKTTFSLCRRYANSPLTKELEAWRSLLSTQSPGMFSYQVSIAGYHAANLPRLFGLEKYENGR